MSTINVPGLGPVPVNPFNQTSDTILKEYTRLMENIQNIFNRPTQATEKDVEELLKAMQELKELAEKGDSLTSPLRAYYLNEEMIGRMNLIFNLLNNQGISVDESPLNGDLVAAIQLLKEFTTKDEKGETLSFLQILGTSMEGLASSTQSLGQRIWLDVIVRGCEFFNKEMLSLEEALQLSKKVISTLTNIQNASNQWEVLSPDGFKWPPAGADDIPGEMIEELAKTIYKNDPAKQKQFIDTYNLWKSLPEGDTQKPALSSYIAGVVGGYLQGSIGQEEELLKLAEKHFGPLYPTPNPGASPELRWPPTAIFTGEYPFPYPLPEEMLKEIAAVLNTVDGTFTRYGDQFLMGYDQMIKDGRPRGAVEDYVLSYLKGFRDVDAKATGGEGFEQLHQVFQKYFDQLHPNDPTLVNGEQLLAYAKELEEYIQTLENLGISRTETNSLAYALDKIAKGINKAFEGVDENDPAAMAGAMSRWIMDNRDKGPAGGGGSFQDDLQKAIGAAQSLKDEKVNDLQEIKNKFDEFMKMAASLIDTLKRIAQTLTRAFSGGH